MATYNTPYKSGTFNGVLSGTTFTTSGTILASSDVGRLIIITTGDGRLQHREITAVSGQNITIHHSWDTNPFIDPTADQRASDVLPASGDAFAISYDADDLVSTDADITSSSQDLLTLGSVVVSGNAYIHFRNYTVVLNPNSVKSGNSGGLIFGYYEYVANQDGYFKDSCKLILTGGGTGQLFRVSSASFGMIDVYGGEVDCNGQTPFLRMYQDPNGATQNQVRWIGVRAKGSLGGRVDGNRSMVTVENVDSTTTFGIFNPRSALARVEFTALNCNQAGYVYLAEGATGRAVFPRLVSINTRLLRVTGTSSGGVEAYEVVAKKSEVDLIPAFATVDNTDNDHTLRYGNLVRPKYIDGSGTSISTDIKTRLYDTTNAFINEENVTGGDYTELFVRHTDIPTTVGTKTLASGTQYAPYSLRNVQYGKKFTTANINAEDTFEPDIVMLDDADIVETSKAVAEAYTEQDANVKIYESLVSWLQDNITDELSFLIDIDGNAGSYDINIQSGSGTRSVVGNTINLFANSLTGVTLNTTGTITVADGIDISGSTFSSLNLTSAQDLTDVTVTGDLTFQDDSAGDFSLTNCEIGLLENDGVGLLNFSNSGSIVGDATDAEVNVFVESFLLERFGGLIRVINPNTDALIYEGDRYSFLLADLPTNPVKITGLLGDVWMDTNLIVTLTEGGNEVDFGVAGSISKLPSLVADAVWDEQTSEHTIIGSMGRYVTNSRDKVLTRIESIKEN